MTELVLPNSVQTYRCEVPGCGQHFYYYERLLKHAPKCARKNRMRIVEDSEEREAKAAEDPMQMVHDPEALDWVRKQIREGREGYGDS